MVCKCLHLEIQAEDEGLVAVLLDVAVVDCWICNVGFGGGIGWCGPGYVVHMVKMKGSEEGLFSVCSSKPHWMARFLASAHL